MTGPNPDDVDSLNELAGSSLWRFANGSAALFCIILLRLLSGIDQP